MPDRHLNLFYSYNRDNELIENNLTRAWIVSLDLLSGKARNALLKAVLTKPLRDLSMDALLETLSFLKAQFALQGYMSRSKLEKFRHKFILTVASHSDTERAEETAGAEQDGVDTKEMIVGTRPKESYLGSIPDGWIYDEHAGYCFLIEAKVGRNPLDYPQVYSHAKVWFGQQGEWVKGHILSLTWVDVLAAVHRVRAAMSSGKLSVNDQECQVLDALTDYLGFFGYRFYNGFDFRGLGDAPSSRIFLERKHQRDGLLSSFSGLQDPPTYHLIVR